MTESQTIGAYLRAARRRRRVSIERAAEDTRIRADFLMRMESDELDFLAPTYVKGFLRTYARYLRIDPEPLVHDFDSRYGSARVDTAQIVALDGRSRKLPKEPKPRNNWLVAAVTALFILGGLSLIGLAQSDPPTPRDRPAANPEAPQENEAPEDEPTPAESPTPEDEPEGEDETLALADGLEVEIVAERARCWIDVTSDGESKTPGGITLEVGHRAEFSADERMQIVFGFAPGVDLIVNGRNMGAPPGSSVATLTLPDDIEGL